MRLDSYIYVPLPSFTPPQTIYNHNPTSAPPTTTKQIKCPILDLKHFSMYFRI